jgi:hypothetical protein
MTGRMKYTISWTRQSDTTSMSRVEQVETLEEAKKKGVALIKDGCQKVEVHDINDPKGTPILSDEQLRQAAPGT